MSGIMIATEIFPPEIGGPATFSLALAETLVRRGQPVTVVCTSLNEDGCTDENLHFRVHRVDIRRRYRFEVEMRARLAIALRQRGRGLVSGLERYAFSSATPAAGPLAVKVVGDVVWESGRNQGWINDSFDTFQELGRPAHGRLAEMYDQRAAWLQRAARIITPSEYLKGVVAGWGVPPERISAILNGTSEIPRPPPEQIALGDELRVLFVGRLTNWKGVETAILAAIALEGVSLTVLGDGPELPMLRRLVTLLGANDRVRLLGRAAHGAVIRVSAEHDIGILLSEYEGLSHTLLEMSARGLPVLCSDIGGNREVVDDGESGWLVPLVGLDPVVDVIRRLRDDREEIRRVADGARAMAQLHRFDDTARQTAALLLEL